MYAYLSELQEITERWTFDVGVGDGCSGTESEN